MGALGFSYLLPLAFTLCCCLFLGRPGENHRSLPELLQQLQARLAASGATPASPGWSAAQPLHIMMQVRALHAASGGTGVTREPACVAVLWRFNSGGCLQLPRNRACARCCSWN
jgi:hypothetical protein